MKKKLHPGLVVWSVVSNFMIVQSRHEAPKSPRGCLGTVLLCCLSSCVDSLSSSFQETQAILCYHLLNVPKRSSGTLTTSNIAPSRQ